MTILIEVLRMAFIGLFFAFGYAAVLAIKAINRRRRPKNYTLFVATQSIRPKSLRWYEQQDPTTWSKVEEVPSGHKKHSDN
jgi:hypothetical protein